jgi:acyl-CoA reductase-like NAD-dependent aldehyde dehydrogenase
VIPHDGDDDAVRLANDSPDGLAGRVWTTDLERGAAVASRLRVGSASLNTLPPVDLAGPYGGVKLSGIGREGGPEGFDAYIEDHTLVLPAAT